MGAVDVSHRNAERAGRRRRHRLPGLVLGVGTAVLLAGCGFANTSGGGGAKDDKSLDITVSTEQHAGLAGLIADFRKSTGITVSEKYAATADLNQTLRVQLSSGTAPDVFRVSPGSSSPIAAKVLGRAGELASLSGSWTKSVPEASRTLSTVDGRTMAFPLSQNVIVMAYNKAVFSRLGLIAPSTWSEFLAVCAKVKAAGITPVSAGFTGGIYLQFPVYQLAASIVYSDTGLDAKMQSGQVTFANSAAWKEVFTKLVALQKAGYLTKGANGVSGDQATQAVVSGKAAMIGVVSALLPASGVGVFALPGTDDASQTRVPVAPDFLGVNAKAKHAANAKKFIEFLAQPANVAKYAEAIKALPGLEGTDATVNPVLDPVTGLITAGKTASYANYLWPNGDTQQTLLQSGQQVLTGELSVDALLGQLTSEYKKGSA